MIPGARLQAAIEVLDKIAAGEPAEKALSNWARSHRFAGSKDRAAIRDHVFDALRKRRSLAALGGSDTGRGLMIGLLREAGDDPAEIFNGEGYNPAALTNDEVIGGLASTAPSVALDCPDWLYDRLAVSVGENRDDILSLMRERAPVFLRVNTRKGPVNHIQDQLSDDGIETRPHPLSPTALEVTSGERRIRGSKAYADGSIELQDAGSQAISDMVSLPDGGRMLDYCAGGGGKSLAVAARVQGVFVAHDVAMARMKDLPDRAARAGVEITCVPTRKLASLAPFDAVVVDAPCSGSGAWRRNPDGKWSLTPGRLNDLVTLQSDILDKAARLVAPGGALIYMTCSLLEEENTGQIRSFLERHPSATLDCGRSLTPLDGGDGFFIASLTGPF
ncbi:RsmB/NOP family class I SAM-dependent RNA methyltransferase [Qingshengfaniella alkalisoli]|uniref:RsmB/NOP family class I SAM-dependent RNA methyltransferase n=1 Tax=Qingshengfaniella alkalisoli TaxID=2599296 RepID=A0A5B8I753_9RHOB|nr:RsmB/NOP family class I SAM-dependent RNA methyltransferase [Qingshengfaniella alkalisoli]QDY69389.1 RsmB/NOP family class I SAM-dependent RNA methyltransferase [Qingshengfaniella alkalisoli]